jgi:hypothetical protein
LFIIFYEEIKINRDKEEGERCKEIGEERM